MSGTLETKLWLLADEKVKVAFEQANSFPFQNRSYWEIISQLLEIELYVADRQLELAMWSKDTGREILEISNQPDSGFCALCTHRQAIELKKLKCRGNEEQKKATQLVSGRADSGLPFNLYILEHFEHKYKQLEWYEAYPMYLHICFSQP